MVNIAATTPESQVLKTLFDSYEAVDVESTARLFSKDFRFNSIPKTNERPGWTKDEYIQKKMGWAIGVTEIEATIHDLVETPGKVAFHATMKGITRDGATHSYDLFRILTLVEEEGELKIIELKDFNNPTESNRFERDLARSQAKV